MKRLRCALQCALTLGLLFVGSMTNAMDGVFDHSAEIPKYLDVIKNGTRASVIESGRNLYRSGISSPDLAAALNERLLSEIDKVPSGDSIGKQYVEWMVKALAATSTEYAETLQQVAKRGRSLHIDRFCAEEIGKLNWYKARNEVMSSRQNFEPNGDVRATQIMNLLKSDDFAMKQFAADRMNWDRIMDPSLIEEVSRQVLRYMNVTNMASPPVQIDALGLYVKILGYSNNPKYRETLNALLKSKVHKHVKMHAKRSLQNLRT